MTKPCQRGVNGIPNTGKRGEGDSPKRLELFRDKDMQKMENTKTLGLLDRGFWERDTGFEPATSSLGS
jgi:hypothetical protein